MPPSVPSIGGECKSRVRRRKECLGKVGTPSGRAGTGWKTMLDALFSRYGYLMTRNRDAFARRGYLALEWNSRRRGETRDEQKSILIRPLIGTCQGAGFLASISKGLRSSSTGWVRVLQSHVTSIFLFDAREKPSSFEIETTNAQANVLGSTPLLPATTMVGLGSRWNKAYRVSTNATVILPI